MVTIVEVRGQCDSRFSAVEDAFRDNFATRDEVGASVAVYAGGKLVVDLWGGYADAARSRLWEQDTIVNVYSTTKGMTAICAHRLADQGKLDFDAPVAKYWPEFAQAGKGDIPVRYLLSHRAGLPAVSAPLPPEAMFDWARMTNELAAQEPWWVPGTKHGYHAITYGWLVGEVVKRITGKSLGTYFREEVAGPLGLDFHIGLDAKHDARTADYIAPLPLPPGESDPLQEVISSDPQGAAAMAITNPGFTFGVTDNSREWRAAEIPAANGHGNGRSIARAYAALSLGGELDGARVLSSDAIDRAIVEQSNGQDAVLGVQTRFGLGFMLGCEIFRTGTAARGFGHSGAGGSVGIADPDAGIGFGYAMNQNKSEAGDEARYFKLLNAAYASL